MVISKLLLSPALLKDLRANFIGEEEKEEASVVCLQHYAWS
jgi:hypothetical protein